jgi:hypothetical protein
MKPRLAKMSVVAGILLGIVCCPARLHGDTLENRARMDLSSIEKALQTFKVNNGHYPQSLQELTERQPNGSAALLKAHAIRDPWGQPYHFDPGQLDPERGVPLVWSDCEPGQANRKIANWGEYSTRKPSLLERIRPVYTPVLLGALVGLLFVRWRYFKEGTIHSAKSRLAQVLIEISIVVVPLLWLGLFAVTGVLD